jgi:hypothetical protein
MPSGVARAWTIVVEESDLYDGERKEAKMSEDYEAWVPQRAIEQLVLKRALQDVEDPIKLANDLLKEALPLSVMGMVHIAVHETNPITRFNAQKYIIDRNMGSVQSPTKPESEAPAWQKIFDSIAVVADNRTEA